MSAVKEFQCSIDTCTARHDEALTEGRQDDHLRYIFLHSLVRRLHYGTHDLDIASHRQCLIRSVGVDPNLARMEHRVGCLTGLPFHRFGFAVLELAGV